MENSISINNLLPFQTKKFFNYFIYYLPKDIEVSSHEVYDLNGYPYICYIYFENEKGKNKFIEKYQGKNFPSTNKIIEICTEPNNPVDLKLDPKINSDDLISFKCNYETMADEQFEKNFVDDGLIYIDFEEIERQRQSVSYLVKKLGANILKGESVMNISLPVFMFDERSLSET